MNEIFDIKRWWKLVQYEVVNYIPNFFKSLLIFASVIAAVWIFSLTVDFAVWPDGRAELVSGLFALAIMLSPFIVYKDMNNRKKGYIYAMIPASTLEKLLSMFVLCVLVVPVLAYAVLTGTDLLLWLLSQMGMGSFYKMDFYNPFVDALLNATYNYDGLSHSFPILDGMLYIIGTISYTMMFNTIFRKSKVLRTILFNIAMVFASVILTSMVVNIATPEFWERLFEPIVSYYENLTFEESVKYTLVLGRCASIIFATICLVITYFRIKKVNS